MKIRAYECGVHGTDWVGIVNAQSRGKAKSKYWYDVTDAWENVPYTAIWARVAGPPHTSQMFKHVAKMRGVPHVKAGMTAVLTNGRRGPIVDAGGGGAYFIVLLDGCRSYVHPGDIERYEEP